MIAHPTTWLVDVSGLDGSVPIESRVGYDGPYNPNDTFVVGWSGAIEAAQPEAVPGIVRMLSWADIGWPPRRRCRAMQLGDVVVVGEVAYACEMTQFRRLKAAPRNIIRGTYADYLRDISAGR